MSRELDLNVNLMRSILWQYENADKLKALVIGQQEWINANHTKFWNDWIRDVFNLKTANAFGLSVWARILNVSLTIEREQNIDDVFGFGIEHENFNSGGFGVAAGAIDNVSVEQARKMLLARYFTLTYAPTVPNINMILEVLFGEGAVYVVDSLDMRYSTYTFNGEPDYRTRELLKNVDFLPRPAAVGVDFTILPDDAFGFGEHHLNFGNGGFTERRYI